VSVAAALQHSSSPFPFNKVQYFLEQSFAAHKSRPQFITAYM